MRATIFLLLLCGIPSLFYAQPKTDSMLLSQEKALWLKKNLSRQVSLASGNYVVNYYRCEWQIDPAKNFIDGIVTPYFTITSPGSSMVLDLSFALKVDSVFMRSQKLSFSQDPNGTLTIILPSVYPAGKKDSVSIFYNGAPEGGGFGSFIQSTHAGTPVIWTLSEPYGSKDWWPCRNGLDDKADSMDIYITHPSEYKASSNGLLTGTTVQGNNTTTHYQHRYPIASYLVALAVTNFSVFTENIQINNKNLPVISYVYPEDSAYFHGNIGSTLNGLELFSSKFSPYPFLNERYGLTEFGWGGGMEHQTNSFVTNAEEGLVTHELAHQWFGDQVTCGSWEDIWLNEGFATFCADFLYTEVYNIPQNKLNIKSDLDYIVSSPSGSVRVDDTTNVGRIFDGRLSYKKGAFLLRMLRWTLGDSFFFKGITNYLNDPQLTYGFARTRDLQRHLENVSGHKLNYFFKQWYLGQGYPSITAQWSQVTNRKVAVMLSQTTSHSSVPFFKIPLALTFKNSTNEKTVVVNFTRNNQAGRIDIGFIADTVIIDRDLQLISKDNKSVHVPAPASVEYSVSVSPNPFKDQVQINLRKLAGKKLLLQVFDNGGQLIKTTTSYPRYDDEKVMLLLSGLLPGNYMLQVSGKDILIRQTLIKQ